MNKLLNMEEVEEKRNDNSLVEDVKRVQSLIFVTKSTKKIIAMMNLITCIFDVMKFEMKNGEFSTFVSVNEEELK